MIESMHRISTVAWVATAALVLAACSAAGGGGGSTYGSGDASLAASNLGGGPIDPFLTDGQAVLKALDAIEQQSGRPLRVTTMTADRMNGLSVDVQEPAHHKNVDRFVISPEGKMTGPTPVQVMSMDGGPVTDQVVDRSAFDPRKVGFGRLTQTAREAIAKSGLSDARVSEWEISGIGPDDRRFIYLEASRGRPAADVRADLTIERMSY